VNAWMGEGPVTDATMPAEEAKRARRLGEVDQTNPEHYKSGGMEAIQIIEAFDLGYHRGNALKYILRAGRKDDAVLDLRKAVWYLQREMARVAAGDSSEGEGA